jgi:hypothetical protein
LAQLHRKFTDEQVKELIEKYLKKEVGRKYLQEILGVNKTRFFALVKAYRDDPSKFSIRYVREGKTRAIPEAVEANILKELTIEKALINEKMSRFVPTITAISRIAWKENISRKWLCLRS